MTNLSVYHKKTKGIISIYNSNLGFIQAVGCKVVISNSYINVTTTTLSHDTLIKVMTSVVDIRNFRNDAEASPLIFMEAISSEISIRDSQISRMDSVNSVSLSNGSRLFMINTVFIQNTFLGGTICAVRNCLLEIINCSFVANTGRYGLVMEENTTLKLEESTFVKNAAIHSEGVTNRLLLHRNVFEMTSISVNNGGNISISDSTILHASNTTWPFMYLQRMEFGLAKTVTTIYNCVFIGRKAQKDNLILRARHEVSVFFINCSFMNNLVVLDILDRVNVILKESKIVGTVSFGSLFVVWQSRLQLINTLIADHQNTGNMYTFNITQSSLKMEGCSYENNEASRHFLAFENSEMFIHKSSFLNNTVYSWNSAILDIRNAHLQVKNCDFQRNTGVNRLILSSTGSSIAFNHNRLENNNNNVERGIGELMKTESSNFTITHCTFSNNDLTKYDYLNIRSELDNNYLWIRHCNFENYHFIFTIAGISYVLISNSLFDYGSNLVVRKVPMIRISHCKFITPEFFTQVWNFYHKVDLSTTLLTYNSTFSDGNVSLSTSDTHFLSEAQKYRFVVIERQKELQHWETQYASRK